MVTLSNSLSNHLFKLSGYFAKLATSSRDSKKSIGNFSNTLPCTLSKIHLESSTRIASEIFNEDSFSNNSEILRISSIGYIRYNSLNFSKDFFRKSHRDSFKNFRRIFRKFLKSSYRNSSKLSCANFTKHFSTNFRTSWTFQKNLQ